MSTPITEQWLRDHGFTWHQLERCPSHHWLLWIGGCLPGDQRSAMPDDFGVELAKVHTTDEADQSWYVWFRADYGGRYSRLLCAGHVDHVEQIEGMISGIIGRPVDWKDVMYGRLCRPDQAEFFRQESDRLDLRIAEQRMNAVKVDGTKGKTLGD